MSVDTHGKIKGFVRHEEILNFIRQKWDKDASDSISKHIICPISKCTWKYKFNEHSEDNENYYSLYGHICFKYNDEDRSLFYCYFNVNSYDNLDYYSKRNLSDMVETETTYLTLSHWGSSVEIIKNIIENFGGGWIDENDCDDKEYYPVEAKANLHTIIDLKIGDTVKVKDLTIYRGKRVPLISIGTICRVIGIDGDSIEIVPQNISYEKQFPFSYLRNELEKGHMEWVKDE